MNEITHHESAPITLEHMASSALLLSTNVYLTHFFGDWAKEMLSPDHRTDHSGHQNFGFQNRRARRSIQ